MRDLSIIIVSYNTSGLTLACLKRIYSDRTRYNFDVWVVDNASTDDTVVKIKNQFAQVNLIINDQNLGFAGGNNSALRKIKGKSRFYLLINTDTLIREGFINIIVDTAIKNNFGITSCKLYDGRNNLQPNTGNLPGFWAIFIWLTGIDDIFRKWLRVPSYQERKESYYKGTKTVGWVSGSVMLISDKVLSEVGLLDDKLFMYGEDVDYCLRARIRDFRIGWTDSCSVIHFGGKSSENANYFQWLGEFKGLIYIYNKHYGKIQAGLLKILIEIFIGLRIFVFRLIGRGGVSEIYAKILKNI